MVSCLWCWPSEYQNIFDFSSLGQFFFTRVHLTPADNFSDICKYVSFPQNLFATSILQCPDDAFWKMFSAQFGFVFVLSGDQAALWMVQFICLSVCHTICIMFSSSSHHEIFRSYYHWQKWCPCNRSRSEIKGQGRRGQKPFPDRHPSLNSHMAMKWCTKLDVA